MCERRQEEEEGGRTKCRVQRGEGWDRVGCYCRRRRRRRIFIYWFGEYRRRKFGSESNDQIRVSRVAV